MSLVIVAPSQSGSAEHVTGTACLSGVAQSLGQLVAHVTGYCGTISRSRSVEKVTDKAVVVWLSQLGSLSMSLVTVAASFRLGGQRIM